MAHPLMELKEMARSQKTISTSKLLEYLDAIDRDRILQADKIKRQTNSLNKLNQENQRLNTKLKEFNNIKLKYSTLKTEYQLVLEKHRRKDIVSTKSCEVRERNA